MLIGLIVLQVLTLVMAVLALRRRMPQDERLAVLPDALVRHEARLEAIENTVRLGLTDLSSGLRGELATSRGEAARHAVETRDAQERTASHLREEVSRSIDRLSTTLGSGLDTFRTDNRDAANRLQKAVSGDLQRIGEKLNAFISESGRAQVDAQEALHTRLSELQRDNAGHQEKIRGTVGESLAKLTTDNAAKLEEMRTTVDEKLQSTLHDRLTQSFGQVTDQLNKVHTGLGEMTKLSAGVDGLSRIFTNVRSRGAFAEVQLGMLLEQMLAPSQFVRNARVKPRTLEVVEFAVRFPTNAGERLLPIDAKFPREAWERLQAAYEASDPDGIQREGRGFENAMRTEAERICGKYIYEPTTTPYAIMFLPTEGLYAEVIRREALQAEIQSKCRVTIAGPTTLAAILTSFKMGFNMLVLQEKGDEVWKVLEAAKAEFGNFGILMNKVERQVGTVQKTLKKIGGKTKTINRKLKSVSDPVAGGVETIAFEDFAGVAPRLAAVGEED